MDKKVPMDVASLAVRLSDQEGIVALHSQELRAAVQNMSSTLSSVQAETRSLTESIHSLALQQATNQRDREAIERLERNFSDLNARLESWFNDSEARQDRLWAEHNVEAAKKYTAIWSEINRIDKAFVFSRGYVLGIIGLVSVLVGGFLWALNQQFEQANKATSSLQETAQYNRSLIDAQREKQHEMELYLARGGNNNAQEPYEPEVIRE